MRRDGVRGPRLLPRRASRSPRGAPTCGRPAASRPTATGSRSCSRSACGTRSSPAPPPSSSPGPCTPTTRPGCSRASRAGPRRRSCPGSSRPSTRAGPWCSGSSSRAASRAIGDNHQVVAYGYEQDRATGRTTVLIYDNNTPRKAVTLTSDADQHDWTASNGHSWRGFFLQDYTPRRPRVLTKKRARRQGPGVHRRHRQAVARVDRPDPALPRPAVHPPRHRRPPAGHVLRGFRRQRPLAARRDRRDARRHRPARRVGRPAAARVAPAAGSAAAPACSHRSRTSSRSAPPTPPTPPRTGGWRSSTPRPWTAGARVRLVHVATDAALHSHRASDPRLTAGQQEVTGYREARRQRLVDGPRAQLSDALSRPTRPRRRPAPRCPPAAGPSSDRRRR